jgi:hypothetical protein
MKTTLTLLLMSFLFLGFSSNAKAQGIKEAIAKIADGIKPEAFKGKWAKTSDEWKNKLMQLDETDTAGLTSSITTLAKNLKGNAFGPGAKKELMTSLMGGGDKNIGALLTSLVTGLKPEMLTDNLLDQKEKLLDGLKGS